MDLLDGDTDILQEGAHLTAEGPPPCPLYPQESFGLSKRSVSILTKDFILFFNQITLKEVCILVHSPNSSCDFVVFPGKGLGVLVALQPHFPP